MADLSTASDIAGIVSAAWPVLTLIGGAAGFGGGVLYSSVVRKKERRLVSNLRRPVAVIPSAEDSMEHEARLLKNVEFFSIDSLAADGRSVDVITDNYRLVVLRYQRDSDDFWHVYDMLAAKQIPVIVYSKPMEIKIPEDMSRIQRYSLHTLCNTPLRLISDVTSIMSTYPEAR
jgi:hypothetical protein